MFIRLLLLLLISTSALSQTNFDKIDDLLDFTKIEWVKQSQMADIYNVKMLREVIKNDQEPDFHLIMDLFNEKFAAWIDKENML